MDQRHLLAAIDDQAELARLSAWVAAWEPCLSVTRPPRHEILYEPDGTLYALAVGTPMTINLHHRERTIREGDVLVVPPALAIEIEPEVDFFAVRCAGPVPDHFRERFIQVWGYDYFPEEDEGMSSPAPGGDGFRELIPAADLRFPCAVATWRLDGILEASVHRETGYDTDLLLCRAGPVRVSVEETGLEQDLHRGQVLGLGPGLSYRAKGPGRLTLVRLSSSAMFDARRLLEHHRRGRGVSPESVPGSSRPGRP